MADLHQRAGEHGYQLTVDLEQCRVHDNLGFSAKFEIDDFRRRCLLEGLDDIGLTLRFSDQISDFEQRRFGHSASV